jgi:hypothetical protein
MLRSGKTVLSPAVAIALALTATIATQAALGGGKAGPGIESGTVVLRDGRSPDTKDAGIEARQALNLVDGRSPDTKDAAAAAHRNARITEGVAIRYAWPPLDAAIFDGRSPDTKDAARNAHQ